MHRLHIIGGKNHGKTTLIVELVQELTKRNLRVGTIKHTHHRHELDVPGKDSYRHRLAGAEVVVDTSNPGYADAAAMERFFAASGAQLGTAAREAGVRHLVALSAVGAAEIDDGYYRAKQLQEARLRDAGLPFTIVRSTPFYEFIYKIVDAGGEGDTVRLPPVHMQPIGADDLATALARITLGVPANGIVEIAGPDRHLLPDLALTILTANEDPRSIAVDHGPRVRCNAICPGWIMTEMASDGFDLAHDPARAKADAVARHPAGRLGAPGDIANAVAWLVSDQAIFATGQCFVLDGGLTAASPLQPGLF